MGNRFTGLLGFLVISGIFVGDGHVGASNWPRFKGPNGTGISEDKGVPIQWTAKNGVLWRRAIPGKGNSSPVVWENRVFVQSASADGKERLLLCLNASDGQVLWSRSVPGFVARTHPKNTLASSTPATDGEKVYAMFWDGRDISIFAYDFQGNLVWKRTLSAYVTEQGHGPGASPIVYDGKVFFANHQDGSALLFALEAKSGKIAWEAERPAFLACYSTPFVLEKPGEEAELIVASMAGITGYDPKSGGVNWNWTWSFPETPLRTVGSPVSSQGLVFANSGNGGGGRHIVAVKPGEKGNGTKTSKVWDKKRGFPYVPSMLVWKDHLYYVNDQGLASCHVAQTGEPVWTDVRLGGTMTASPVLIDGKIYAVNEEGQVYVFEAGPQFKLLGKSSIGEPVMATPAVATNRLFIRGDKHLFCIGKPADK